MGYKPDIIAGAEKLSTAELVQYLSRELEKVSQAIIPIEQGRMILAYTEPAKKRAGMLVYADGTAWDPGNGAGLYVYTGSSWVFVSPSTAIAAEGRLTVTSGLPVTTSDVTAATTLYYTPYVGECIALYDGVGWRRRTFSELSKTNAGLAASTCHDVFLYYSAGAAAIELLAWTNDTTRATGLVRQNGILVKSGDATRRYVGTIRTDGSSKFEDSFAKRWAWNYYNRRPRVMRALETADTWTYTTDVFRQASATATNQLDCVVGVNEDMVTAHVHAFAQNTNAGVDMIVAIGVDSTTTMAPGCLSYYGGSQVANEYIGVDAHLKTFLAAGRHTLVWLELSVISGTTTWAGDGGAPLSSQSGIHGEIFG